jgi:hypothetical protein
MVPNALPVSNKLVMISGKAVSESLSGLLITLFDFYFMGDDK